MTLQTDIREYLIDRLVKFFGQPKDADALAEELSHHLPEGSGLSDLAALAKEILENRTTKSFPSVAELIMLLRAQSEKKRTAVGTKRKIFPKIERLGGVDYRWVNDYDWDVDAQRFRLNQEGGFIKREEVYDRAEQEALSFLKGTAVAKAAIDDHWAPGLIDFTIREGRPPNYFEEQSVIAKVRRNDVDVRDFVDQPCAAPPRGNVTKRDIPQFANGIGERLRRMRAAMHEASEARLKRGAMREMSS